MKNYSEAEGKLKEIKTEVDKINTLLFAVVVILLLMVGNMLIDSWNNKGASYQSLVDKVNDTNIKIDFLLQKKKNTWQ